MTMDLPLLSAAFAAFAAGFAFCVGEPALIEKLSDVIFGPVNSVVPPHAGSLTFFLLYFNPLARLGEFLAGVAAAHFVLRDHHPWLSGKTAPFATTLVALTVILIHTFVYGANLSPLARSCALWQPVEARRMHASRPANRSRREAFLRLL